jgi:chromosome transmission fidelity protein 1
LISVIGGRLSEGINFKDDLGRCVGVIGMPYPNLKAPEIRTKMNYFDSLKSNVD